MKKLLLTVSLCAVAALAAHALDKNLGNQVNQYALATGQAGLAQNASAVAVPVAPKAVLVDAPGRPGPRRPQEVTGRLRCSSNGGRRHECRTGLRDIHIIRISGESRSCREGRSYGVHSRRGIIWVDDGCRANFNYRGHRR